MIRMARSFFDLALLGRHQVAAFAATVVDFTAMIAFVELLGLAPPLATIASAILGGISNFTLSRTWAYRDRHDGTLHGQAVRYAFVSLGGALLNGALVALLPFVPYVLARVSVSLLVSVLYTYPLHTRVVFKVIR
jgi:putative flippase GtrA